MTGLMALLPAIHGQGRVSWALSQNCLGGRNFEKARPILRKASLMRRGASEAIPLSGQRSAVPLVQQSAFLIPVACRELDDLVARLAQLDVDLVPCRVRHVALRVGGIELVFDEGVERVLLAQVLADLRVIPREPSQY